MSLFDQVLASAATSILTVVAVAWGAAKWLGSKWIEKHFNLELENHKAELSRAIGQQIDRATKLYQMEFAILPEAWAALQQARGAALSYTSRLQQHTDISQMSGLHLEEFLSKASGLYDFQKEELRALKGSERNSAYHKMLMGQRQVNAMKELERYNNVLSQKGIFIERAIRTDMQLLNSMMFEAVQERAICEEMDGVRGPESHTSRDKLWQEGEAAAERLQNLIQDRLWNTAQF